MPQEDPVADRNIHETLARLVSIALKSPDLSVLREMFLDIANRMGGYGCVLWHLEAPLPGVTRAGEQAKFSRHKLAAVAAGFRSRVVYPEHDLPLTIPSGIAMREGSLAVPDLSKIGTLPQRALDFLKLTGIQSLCSVRADFPDGMPGALTLYRQTAGKWSGEEIEFLEYLALRVPQLCDMVRDRVSFRTLDKVSGILQAAEQRQGMGDTVQKKLEEVCHAVAQGFQCLETAIFLEDPLKEPGVFTLAATTSPQLSHCNSYTLNQEGLTPWAARNGPIAVSDVLDFDQSQYLGLRWTDRVRLEATVRSLLELEAGEVTPPISFMAVPVLMGSRVLGVIRCCAARSAPFYFSRSETELLTIIAERIGHFWGNRVARDDLNRELDMWRRFVGAVGVLNKKAQEALSGAVDNQLGLLLPATINAVRHTLPGADYVDISLFDPSTQELVLAYGNWHNEDPSGASSTAFPQRISVTEDPPRTPAAKVFRDKVTLRADADDALGQTMLAAFPDFRHAIYSPILVDMRCLGVIAVRGRSPVDYPLRADQMLELLGRLTGLHYQLQAAFKRQAQTYKVFVHQLRNPVFQAWRRAQKLRGLFDGFGASGAAERYIDAVCGLLGKARSLVINLRLFANLEAGLPVRTDQSVLSPGELVRPLIELASDNRILWQHSRIAFRVDTDSFETRGSISVDMDLLEQVAGNVLDNFGKYGYPDSTTTITALPYPTRELAIAFRGRSIPVLTLQDAQRAGQKGWRGVEARQLSTEGEGVGLWMTSQIMVAHNGRMEVFPTDQAGYTEIRLVFPLL